MEPIKKKAITLLSRKTYFSKQLKAKLIEKGYLLEEVEALIIEFKKLGWLNDEELSQRFIEQQKQKGYGARMIALKLKEKGGSSPLPIEESIEAIEALIAKRYAKKLPSKRPQVIAALMRRGIPYQTILEVIDNK